MTQRDRNLQGAYSL